MMSGFLLPNTNLDSLYYGTKDLLLCAACTPAHFLPTSLPQMNALNTIVPLFIVLCYAISSSWNALFLSSTHITKKKWHKYMRASPSLEALRIHF